jgi:hypothetical protein
MMTSKDFYFPQLEPKFGFMVASRKLPKLAGILRHSTPSQGNVKSE